MRVILRIARLELASLFFSPIAWLVFLVFAVQFGISFVTKLELYASYKALGYNTVNLTDYIFTHGQTPGLFLTVQSQLYLFVPLLTMGLISRELHSGSIKLLQSSPISTLEIILGKYLGIMVYGLLLFSLLFVFIICGGAVIPNFEWTWMFTALVGLFLLFGAYAAIGLFLSSLTSYQVVAAISTLVLLTFLHYIGGLWQDVDFVRHIAYFFSVSGKADSMIGGLVRSKDIIYFLVVISLFLGLTILKMEMARSSKNIGQKIAIYTGFVVALVCIGYVASLPRMTFYKDVTSQGTRTLSKTGIAIVKKMEQPLKITTYVNLLDPDYNIGAKKQRNADMSRFEQYQRFLPDMEMEYVYYYDTCENKSLFENKINKGLSLEQVANNVVETYKLNINDFLTPAEIRKKIDLSAEGNRMVRVLESGDKKTYLRLYNDFFKHPGEPNIVAALKRLQIGGAKIAFVGGYDMRAIDNNTERGYRQATNDITQRNSLVNNGFDSFTLALDNDEIPTDISTLVIADPRQHLSAVAIDKIKSYLDKGGNMLVFAEPEQKAYLEPVLSYLGVDFEEGAMVQNNAEIAANVVYARAAKESSKMGEIMASAVKDSVFKTVFLSPGVFKTVSKSDFDVFPILQVKEKNAWLKRTKLDSDSLRVSYATENGDRAMLADVAIGLTRTVGDREQRIALVSDADFISNIELGTFRKTTGNSNTQFYSGLYEWFTSSTYPIMIEPILPVDNEITLTTKGASAMRVVFVYVFPILLLLLGGLVLTLRKRK